MKVNLTVRGPVLNGYLNLDPTAQPQEQDRVVCQVDNLNDLIDHNEIDEHFLINDVLDFVPIGQRQSLLNHYLTKLAHGGKIIIMGNDLYEISRLIHLGNIDIAQANQIVYGIGRKSFCDPQTNVAIVMNTGQYEFEKISYQGYVYTIIMRRK